MKDIILIGGRDMPTAMQYLTQECTRLKAEKAELLEALGGLLDCISETRGEDATDAVAKARAIKAKAEGQPKASTPKTPPPPPA